jgi:homoserine dehydrogenase
MNKLFDIKGKVVVITGGTGVLGKAIAKYLALEGAKVVILGRRVEAGNAIVEDIKAADQRGNVIKLLCKGTRAEDGTVVAKVKPEEVPKSDMLASIDSTTSVVSITTDLMKKVSVVEHQPEIEQTAYGVFGDMLRVLSE